VLILYHQRAITMTVECAIDFGNEWGYLHCDICDDISLIGMMSSEELTRELEAFKKEHEHDNL